MTPRRAGQSTPPRPPAPASDPYFEVMVSEAQSKRMGNDPSVQVRCLASHDRLFDVVRVMRFSDEYGMEPAGPLVIEKKCPSCKRIQSGAVTANPGYPWVNGPALGGPWRCECGKSLGYAEPIRGRIKTTCRCGAEVRVVAADAIAVASIPTRPVPSVPDAYEDGPPSYADAPF